ncbi:MAG: recombinase family protein [Ethanoligenens sp.]
MPAVVNTTEPQVICIPANIEQAKSVTAHRQKRVAAYCRVSTDQEEQLTSYEAQCAYYTEKIMTNPEWTLAGIFADEGITGTSTKKRERFKKMISLCRRSKIDMVLTKSISRFARNTVDCLAYIRELKELGIPVIFEKENINTMTTDSEIVITMLGGFAQAESESISQNVRWGVRQSFKKGKVTFQYKRMYGYERGEDKCPHVVPEQAKVVRRVFETYLAGSSVKDIKTTLEAEGIPAASGKPVWSVSALQNLLRNEKYTGDALLQKTYIENCITKKTKKNNGELPKYLVKNHHEAIIDHDLFERVQVEIARRAGKHRVSGKNGQLEQSRYSGRYALTELLICGHCGSPYKRVTWTVSGQKRIVWRCSSRLSYGKKYCSESPTIPEEALHAAILSALNSAMANREWMMGILEETLTGLLSEKSGGDLSPALLRSRIGQMQKAMADLLSIMYKADHPEVFDEQIKDLADKIASLQESLDAQENSDEPDELSRQIEDMRIALRDAPFEIPECKDNVVRQMVDTIKVMDENRLRIIFKGGCEVEQLLHMEG